MREKKKSALAMLFSPRVNITAVLLPAWPSDSPHCNTPLLLSSSLSYATKEGGGRGVIFAAREEERDPAEESGEVSDTQSHR